MSKEKKMTGRHELFDFAVRMAKSTAEIECRYKGGNVEDYWSSVLLGEIKRLQEENQEMIRLLSRIHASSGDVFGDQRSFKWENLAFDRCSVENLLYRVKGKL